MEKKFHRNWRTNLILIIIFLCGAAIISRLFFLQILNHKLYQAQALGQQAGFASKIGERGHIFCSNSQQNKGENSSGGEVKSLAINNNEWSIFAYMSQIEDKEKFAEILSQNINQEKNEILSKINTDNSYVLIEKGLREDELNKLKSLNLSGLKWEGESKRYYPQGKFAANVLGFLGGEGVGQYGIEGYYEDKLKGKFGIKEEKKGLELLFLEEQLLNGSDIYLTIDYNIQFKAESLLEEAKEKYNIDSGQILVMKPNTGRILAMANYPSFDPNQYFNVNSMDVFQNATVQKLFEPGSIIKPITMAIAMNEGKINPDTTYIDTGALSFGTKTIHNFDNKVYNQQTMTQVLENSINTGAVYAQEQVSHKTFINYLKRFGFVEKTGIDLQGEVYSHNESLMSESAPDMNFATASFGQGIEVTPIQMIRAFCALINDGKLVTPYIIDKIVSGSDEVYTKPKYSEQVISKETLSKITSMLVSVVDNGFSKVAKINGYYIAGKTGTAQVPLINGKGYDEEKTIQSFIGFGPAYDPQFLILVKLDNPKVSKSSLSAVPIFKQLAQYIINYWQIPPDYGDGAISVKK